MPDALLVDDDQKTLDLLSKLVKQEGFRARTASTLAKARAALASSSPDIVLLDLNLPDGRGLDLLDDFESDLSEVVLITGHGTLETAVEALRKGVSDYIVKPVDVDQLRGVLARVARSRELREEVQYLREELQNLGRFGRMVGRSPAMRAVYSRIAKVAPTDAAVLLTGESGTGKELAARTIHDLSRRRKQDFCALNCGAVPEQMMESQLFGHERGAFTGADRRHHGYFERANNGTLLLDEITEMTAELQVKLLRVLETGEITRLGSEKTFDVDVRLISATNRVPEEAIARGRLREDLSYRLNVFQIHMPPLRERGEDIELLAHFFIEQHNRKEDAAKRLAPATLELLQAYAWPGNVRELRNVLHSAYILADDLIEPDSLPAQVLEGRDVPIDDGGIVRVRLGATLAEAEQRIILSTLRHFGDSKEKTAETLGISVRTVYNRLKEYNPTDGGPADEESADNGD